MNRIFSLALLMAFAAAAIGQPNTGGNVPYYPNKSGSGGPPTGTASNGLTGSYPGPGLSSAAVVGGVAGQAIAPSNFTLTNPGVFTSGQANLYSQSLINGCNPDTEFEAVQFQHGTEGLTGCITGSGSATTHQITAVAGYATGSASASFPVGGYFQARALVNGVSTFGINCVVQDVASLTSGLVPVCQESDVQPYNPPSAYTAGAGLDVELKNQNSQTGTYPFNGIQIAATNNAGGTAYWSTGLDFLLGSLGAASVAINTNAMANAVSGTNYNSPVFSTTYESYWNGSAAVAEGWSERAVVGPGTNPTYDYWRIFHNSGTAPSGQLHHYALDATQNVDLGFLESDGNFATINVPSSYTGGSVATLPNATGTILLNTSAPIQTSLYNVKSYGATGDGQWYQNCSISASSSTLSCPSATFTSAITGQDATVYMGSGYIWGSTFTSGGTVTGSGAMNCNVAFIGGGGSGATATLTTNGNGISTGTNLTMTSGGSGYTSAPTSATLSSGTATCSGTATITSVVLPAKVNTTVTYASATTLTLGTTATTAVSTGFASIGTDDTMAIQAAVSACTGGGGGQVYFPAGYFKTGSAGTALTIANKCSMVGNGPVTTQASTLNPDGSYFPNGGTWIDGSGIGTIMTGNTLRATNLLHLGFMDWSGIGSQAVVIGGNNVDGISFSEISDVQFSGLATTDGSDQALILYNIEHVTSTGLRVNNTNTCLTFNNQSQYIQGGNSEFYGFFCATYAISKANSNNGEHALGVFGSLTPSSGSPLPIDYITFIRPQVNTYGGDGSNTPVLFSGAYSNTIIGFDLEGTWLNGMELLNSFENSVDFSTVNQATGSSTTMFIPSPAAENVTHSETVNLTYNAGLSSNMFLGQLKGSDATSTSTAFGLYAGASLGVTANISAYKTTTNCAAVGTSASPSLAACAAAAAGAFSCATTASAATCVVNTTAVTANSQIFVQEVASESTRLGVTCNTAPTVTPSILLASKSAGASFTINMPTITVNPACFDYYITN